MKKLWTLIRHNRGMTIGIILALAIIVWVFGCPSTVVSIHNPPEKVTRGELELEVEHFLKSAALRFRELDQQDEFKRTIFAMAMDFMKEGKINPLAVVITLGNILGLGAIIDNVRKDTHIKTLKGGNLNDERRPST